MDVIAEILSSDEGREQQRLQIKYLKMSRSPFVFLRGTCRLFYKRLPQEELFKTAPITWNCGDLHLENFGSFKGDNRLIYFDINDFEEAALAPVTWDLVRILASIELGAQDVNLDKDDIDRFRKTFLKSYGSALSAGKPLWVDSDTATGLVADLLKKAEQRSREKFIGSRTIVNASGARKVRVDENPQTSKALIASEEQQYSVRTLIETFAKTLPRPNQDFYKVLDVARRVAGTGSLGLDRYVILVEGNGSPQGNYLLDLKECTPSTLLSTLRTPQPTWTSEADRIVTLQRLMQAVPAAFLNKVRMDDKWYVLRELEPSDDSISLDPAKQSSDQIDKLMDVIGKVTAWGHLRGAGRSGAAIAKDLMAFAAQSGWAERLLGIAASCADQVRDDYKVFVEAYRAKRFE